MFGTVDLSPVLRSADAPKMLREPPSAPAGAWKLVRFSVTAPPELIATLLAVTVAAGSAVNAPLELKFTFPKAELTFAPAVRMMSPPFVAPAVLVVVARKSPLVAEMLPPIVSPPPETMLTLPAVDGPASLTPLRVMPVSL